MTKRVKSAGFEVDPSYVYNRSKFLRGAGCERRTERGDDDTCQSIVSLLPTSYRVRIAIVELPQSRWRIVVRMQCQSKKSSRASSDFALITLPLLAMWHNLTPIVHLRLSCRFCRPANQVPGLPVSFTWYRAPTLASAPPPKTTTDDDL
jgi:hypothetical protein